STFRGGDSRDESSNVNVLVGEGQATDRAVALRELGSLERAPTRSDSSGMLQTPSPSHSGEGYHGRTSNRPLAARSAGVRKAARSEGFADESRDLLARGRRAKTHRRKP